MSASTKLKVRLDTLFARLRDPNKVFSPAHYEAVFNIAREAIELLELYEAPVQQVMALADGHEGVNTHVFANALMKKVEGQRKHIATLEEKAKFTARLVEIGDEALGYPAREPSVSDCSCRYCLWSKVRREMS